VLAAGVCAAWPFRHPAGALSLSAGTPQFADVTVRRPDATLEVSLASQPSPAEGLNDANLADSPDAVLLEEPRFRPDLESLGPAPSLSPDFGPTIAPAFTSWQPARRNLTLETPAIRRHRLTDGDSLDKLAERYLGSRDRAEEIYQANRDVLATPDVLPLGRIIRIPPAVSEEELEPVHP
jgi:nucleoid-associated protein YgaU